MEAKAKYQFQPSNDDELSFREGNILKVRNMENKDWYLAELNGRTGYVPSSYIDMEPHEWYKGPLSRTDAEKFLKKNNFDGHYIIRDCQTDVNGFSLSVMHANQPQHFKILSGANGTYYLWSEKTFTSINKLVDWYRQVSVARDPNLTNVNICLRDTRQAAQGEEIVEALYDFQPKTPEEVPFRKGDRIKILDKTDPNWWTGEVMRSGGRGLLPFNFIKSCKC